MKIFEIQFNPRFRKNPKKSIQGSFCSKWQQRKLGVLYNSFSFFPPTKQTLKLGQLCLLGEIKNTLPKNKQLLLELADILQKNYYQNYFENETEPFKLAIAELNKCLIKKAKTENPTLPYKLNLAVLSLTKNNKLSLAQIGSLKILLLSCNQAFSIENQQNTALNFNACFSNFANAAETVLGPSDKIFVATEEVFIAFKEKGLIEKITYLQKAKEIKKALKQNKQGLKDIFGACFLILTEPENKIIAFAKRKTTFLSPIIKKPRFRKIFYIILFLIFLLLGYFLFK